jgi:hypothetical protein
MNSTLAIGSLSGTLVSDDEHTVTSAQETTFEKETAPTSDPIYLQWSYFRIEELFEGILAFLTVAYLIGAVGLGAMLLFYTLHH